MASSIWSPTGLAGRPAGGLAGQLLDGLSGRLQGVRKYRLLKGIMSRRKCDFAKGIISKLQLPVSELGGGGVLRL